MNMNTDTPRTDDQSVRYYDDATGTRIKYVAAKFACQLERELAQRERERDEVRKQLSAERTLANRLLLIAEKAVWDHAGTLHCADNCKCSGRLAANVNASLLTAWKEARSES